MTHKTIQVRQGGKTVLSVPQVTERDDGTLWGAGNTMPLLNTDAGTGKDALVTLVKTKRYDEIPAECYLRRGDNAGGKRVLTCDEAAAEDLANMTDEDRERARVAVERARKAAEYDRIYNEGGEGYNPYREPAEIVDNTPYHKGDDHAE